MCTLKLWILKKIIKIMQVEWNIDNVNVLEELI